MTHLGNHFYDITIIGAGPAGTLCAALLNKAGLKVLIIEKHVFPRFTIGESFLPQNMELLAEADLLDVFKEGQFKLKDGAQFLNNHDFLDIDFSSKNKTSFSNTYQVERSQYDSYITDLLLKRNIEILFGYSVIHHEYCDSFSTNSILTIKSNDNHLEKKIKTRFLVDSSGMARVLPKLLDIKTIYNPIQRYSQFNHIKTEQTPQFDQNKILITTLDMKGSPWFWLIPLKDNYYSVGCTSFLDHTSPLSLTDQINHHCKFKELLGKYHFIYPEDFKAQQYTSSVEKAYGRGFILIGNAQGFIDPIFSSGVTIALKSAQLAAHSIIKEFKTKNTNWEDEYIKPLKKGVDVFQAFIDSWYSNNLLKIIFFKDVQPKIKEDFISILAGYAWDEDNIYYSRPAHKLNQINRIIEAN